MFSFKTIPFNNANLTKIYINIILGIAHIDLSLPPATQPTLTPTIDDPVT